MTFTHEKAATLIGIEALTSLLSRDLVIIQPFPGLAITPSPVNRGSRSKLTVGAQLGVALSRAARRRIRHSGSCDPQQLLATAVSEGDLRDAHCLQMEASFRFWSSSTSDVPQQISGALNRIPQSVSGVGTALRRLWAVGQNEPWFTVADDSFGFGGLTRCVGVTEAMTEGQSCAAMADMAITHAHPQATWSAAALSQLLVICRDTDSADLPSAIGALLDELDQSPLRHTARKIRALSGSQLVDQVRDSYRGPTCESALVAAFAAALTADNPSSAFARIAATGAPSAVMAAVGSVFVARFDTRGFPDHWASPVEAFISRHRLAYQVAQPIAEGSSVTPSSDDDHIWVLLDRSGSMEGIRSAMEVGFDRFIADQKSASAPSTLLTLVQFDDQQVHEVIVDAAALEQVPSLLGRLVPRGRTPLYDAIGRLLDRAEEVSKVGERQLVLVITDGQENASRFVGRDDIFGRIRDLESRGWTFVYLGANQDSYAQGGRMAVADGNISNFEFSEMGVGRLYDGLSRATNEWRGKDRAKRLSDRRDFWGGHREAEGPR